MVCFNITWALKVVARVLCFTCWVMGRVQHVFYCKVNVSSFCICGRWSFKKRLNWYEHVILSISKKYYILCYINLKCFLWHCSLDCVIPPHRNQMLGNFTLVLSVEATCLCVTDQGINITAYLRWRLSTKFLYLMLHAWSQTKVHMHVLAMSNSSNRTTKVR